MQVANPAVHIVHETHNCSLLSAACDMHSTCMLWDTILAASGSCWGKAHPAIDLASPIIKRPAMLKPKQNQASYVQCPPSRLAVTAAQSGLCIVALTERTELAV